MDLGDCELMDSTFMGTLAGVALRLREIGQGITPRRQRQRAQCRPPFQSRSRPAFTVEPIGTGGPVAPKSEDLVRAAPPKVAELDQKEVVLEAHEALVEADSSNAAKFRDVLEYLRQELGAKSENE